MVRVLDKTDPRCLTMCATHFRRAGQYQFAKETLLKMDDTKALISLYVDESKWDDAFLLLNAHPGTQQFSSWAVVGGGRVLQTEWDIGFLLLGRSQPGRTWG